MKSLIFAAAAFGTLATVPAMAQGCGMMQQTANQTTESKPAAGGMICSAGMAAGQSTAAEQTQASGGCPCCKNMAMMDMPAEGGMSPLPEMEMPGTEDVPTTTPAE